MHFRLKRHAFLTLKKQQKGARLQKVKLPLGKPDAFVRFLDYNTEWQGLSMCFLQFFILDLSYLGAARGFVHIAGQGGFFSKGDCGIL